MIDSRLLTAVGSKGAAEILERLVDGPRRPGELAESSGVSQPTAYLRLKELQDAGVIEACIVEEEGRTHKGYRLTPLGRKLVETMDNLR